MQHQYPLKWLAAGGANTPCIQLIVASLLVITALFPLQCPAASPVLNKDQMVASIQHGKKQYDLVWAITDRPWPDQQVFVTVHQDQGSDAAYLAHIYLGIPGGFKLAKQLVAEKSRLGMPQLLWMDKPKGSDQRYRVLLIPQTLPGTGNLRQLHAFFLDDFGRLHPIEVIPATTTYAAHVREGYEIRKGETNAIADDTLRFSFYLWRRGDGNCCPTGGQVSGHYVLRYVNNALVMVADEFNHPLSSE